MVSLPKVHETAYRKLANVFDRPLPEFVKEKELFVAFFQAYYEWLDKAGLLTDPPTSDLIDTTSGSTFITTQYPEYYYVGAIISSSAFPLQSTVVSIGDTSFLIDGVAHYRIEVSNAAEETGSETAAEIINPARTITSTMDVDTTPQGFLKYFREEFLKDFPEDIYADQRLIIKKAKEIYSSKGTEKAIKFLFRALYNEEVEVYYPKVDILRASDGKWYIKKSVFTTYTMAEQLSSLYSRQVQGTISEATGIVEEIILHDGEGPYAEFVLSDIVGDFVEGEMLRGTEYSTGTVIQEKIFSVVNSITPIDGGTGYKKGDPVFVITNDSNQTVVGRGVVKKLQSSPVSSITVDDGGTGYRGNLRHVTKFLSLPITYVLNGQALNLTPVSAIDSNDVDYPPLPLTLTVPGVTIPDTGDIVVITDIPTSDGNGASAVVAEVDDDGKILVVDLISGGEKYEQPEAAVISTTGSGALLTANGGGSAISSVELTEFAPVMKSDGTPGGILSDYTTTTLTYGNNTASFTLGSGTLGTYPGRFLNRDGFLSSDKYLQDNDYYQTFSYVLRSRLTYNQYATALKGIIHPTGLKMFGEFYVITLLDMSTSIVGDNLEIETDQSLVDNLNIETTSSVNIQIDPSPTYYFYQLCLDDVWDVVLDDIWNVHLDDPTNQSAFDEMSPVLKESSLEISDFIIDEMLFLDMDDVLFSDIDEITFDSPPS